MNNINVVLLVKHEVAQKMSNVVFDTMASVIKSAIAGKLVLGIFEDDVHVYQYTPQRFYTSVDVQILVIVPTEYSSKLEMMKASLDGAVTYLEKDADTKDFMIQLNRVVISMLLAEGLSHEVELHM